MSSNNRDLMEFEGSSYNILADFGENLVEFLIPLLFQITLALVIK